MFKGVIENGLTHRFKNFPMEMPRAGVVFFQGAAPNWLSNTKESSLKNMYMQATLNGFIRLYLYIYMYLYNNDKETRNLRSLPMFGVGGKKENGWI